MGVSIVAGLAVVCAAVYCDGFKFSGLDPLFNHGRQFNGIQNYNAPPTLQLPCHNGFHHGPYQKNSPQFGPFSDYQSPVAYSVQSPFFDPATYPQSSYRLDRPNSFGFASFSAPVQNQYTGKTVFSNVPEKNFQEHQFNVNHGYELSTPNVPVEHGIKQYKLKDTILNHPIIPFESLFKNFPKPAVIGFIPVGFAGQQGFPQIQPFYQTSLGDKSTQTSNRPIVVNQDVGDKLNAGINPVPANLGETATLESVLTNNPSLEVSTVESLPIESDSAQKLEPTNSSPSQEEANSITTGPTADVSNNNEAPAAIDTAQDSKQNEDQSNVATTEESNEPNTVRNEAESTTSVNQENTSQSLKEDSPVTAEDFKETVTENNNLSTDTPAIVNQDNSNSAGNDNDANTENNSQITSDTPNEVPNPNIENNSQVTSDTPNEVLTENNSDVQSDSNNENLSDQPKVSTDLPQSTSTEVLVTDKPADTVAVEENPVNSDVAAFQNVLNAPIVSASDPNLFSETDFSAFNRLNNLAVQQPLYIYDPVSLIGSNTNTFSNPGSTVQPSVEVLNNGEKSDAAKNDASVLGNDATTENTVILSSSVAPSLNSDNSENKQVTKTTNTGVEIQSPKKSNTVQIIQEGPVFSGQFPSLYDPSSNSQLDGFKFFDHPSIKAYAGQASMNSYSPETAFTDFDALFKQGYFIEGSPSLTPEANTANILSIKSATPMSIASKSHPLHSQVFKYSPSHVLYPGTVVKSSEQGARIVDFTHLAEPIVDVKSWPSTTTSASPSSTSTQTPSKA